MYNYSNCKNTCTNYHMMHTDAQHTFGMWEDAALSGVHLAQGKAKRKMEENVYGI